MNTNVEKIGEVAVITMDEEVLDSSNHEDFMDSVTPILEEESQVVLDVGNLEMVDSSGLGSFAYCLRKCRDTGGRLMICSPSDNVREAFSLVHMERIIGIHETRDDAIEALANA